MKHLDSKGVLRLDGAAAFGRLCVETKWFLASRRVGRAAAFGRLCVETDLLSPRRAAVCKKENQMN